MEPPFRWRCAPPCDRVFSSQQSLSRHRTHYPDCSQRFEAFIRSLQPTTAHSYILNQSDLVDFHNAEDTNEVDTVVASPFDNDDQELDITAVPVNLSSTNSVPLVVEDLSSALEDVFEGAGQVLAAESSTFLQCRMTLEAEEKGLYYPFESESEWKLAAWLHESGISTLKMNEFLHLPYVKSNPPEFKNSAALIKKLHNLPYPGPSWRSRNITPTNGRPSERVVLIYRDPLETIRYLFSRPEFADDMDYAPRRVYSDEGRDDRIYSEMSTADWWWETQAELPQGATVVPVILGSDGTHLTSFAGGKKAWPIYLTIGNIRSRTRNKPSKKAWMLLGYIPQVNFLDDDKIRTTLTSRLYHECMEFLLSPLIEPGINGTHIKDSIGHVRHCFPLVAAHIADQPEQLLINIAARFSSPFTTAQYDDLENPEPSPPRTREWILSAIQSACDEADPSNIKRYQKAARQRGINAVHRPYWRNLPRYRPESVICPDIMHGGQMFWRDHPLAWSRRLVSADEYDMRLRSLQQVPYYRHFRSGIKHLSQWTCREDRELLRTHVALIAGCPNVNRRVMQSQRAIADFLYILQYESHSQATLGYLTEALQIFHDTKGVYISLGVRRGIRGVINHFKIPKLSALSEFSRHIIQMGASPQYSTEIIETLHRTLAKELYQFTNHKNFVVQMCNRLDRSERIAHHQEFLNWCKQEDERRHRQQLFSIHSPGFLPIAIEHYTMVMTENNGEKREKPVPITTRITKERLWLTLKPHLPRQIISDIAQSYQLADLEEELKWFLHSRAPDLDEDELLITHVNVWKKLRIRMADVQDEEGVSQEHSVEAIPPSTLLPYGRCHCVLVHMDSEAQETGIEGYCVAQVRLLFEVHLQDTRSRLHKAQLAYVQFFSKPKPVAERDILMYTVSRQDRDGIRRGAIIPMQSIARFIQLIPKFGAKAHISLTSENSADICSDYYVNCFADKQIYQSVW